MIGIADTRMFKGLKQIIPAVTNQNAGNFSGAFEMQILLQADHVLWPRRNGTC